MQYEFYIYMKWDDTIHPHNNELTIYRYIFL